MGRQKEASLRTSERRELRVSVLVRGEPAADELRDLVERRVRFALARFGLVLRRARIELLQQRNEVTCQLQLHGVGEPPIAVRAVDPHRMLALGLAIEQGIQELARRLRRGRTVVARTDLSPQNAD